MISLSAPTTVIKHPHCWDTYSSVARSRSGHYFLPRYHGCESQDLSYFRSSILALTPDLEKNSLAGQNDLASSGVPMKFDVAGQQDYTTSAQRPTNAAPNPRNPWAPDSSPQGQRQAKERSSEGCARMAGYVQVTAARPEIYIKVKLGDQGGSPALKLREHLE